MRKIEYIFIDSDTDRCDSASGKPNSLEISRAQAVSSNAQNNNCKSGRHAVPNLGYHYVVNPEGLVLHPTDISIPAHIIQGPIYDPDKYNRCSICIRYCGSLEPGALRSALPFGSSKRLSTARLPLGFTASLVEVIGRPLAYASLVEELKGHKNLEQREALIRLLVVLRSHFPDAKILGVYEIDGRELYSKNIIVSDVMNALRRELSEQRTQCELAQKLSSRDESLQSELSDRQ